MMDDTRVRLPHSTCNLFRAHATYVRKYLAKLGVPEFFVDDTVQEVFLVADRHGYKQGPASPRTWLGAIAIRVAANMRRKVARMSSIPIERVIQLNSNAVPADSLLIKREELSRVDCAINMLTSEQRDVFIYFYVYGHSCEEVAALMAIPVGTVYSRLNIARKLVITCVRENRC
jgi:RNA polymerase sigma-70 factor (ECF subfamily)